jgi:hypothetical protein
MTPVDELRIARGALTSMMRSSRNLHPRDPERSLTLIRDASSTLLAQPTPAGLQLDAQTRKVLTELNALTARNLDRIHGRTRDGYSTFVNTAELGSIRSLTELSETLIAPASQPVRTGGSTAQPDVVMW